MPLRPGTASSRDPKKSLSVTRTPRALLIPFLSFFLHCLVSRADFSRLRASVLFVIMGRCSSLYPDFQSSAPISVQLVYQGILGDSVGLYLLCACDIVRKSGTMRFAGNRTKETNLSGRSRIFSADDLLFGDPACMFRRKREKCPEKEHESVFRERYPRACRADGGAPTVFFMGEGGFFVGRAVPDRE